MRFLLFPFSILFYIITTTRNWLFDYKILRSKTHPIAIICIGNLSIGGSGKTPHTNYIINLLKDKYTIAILSRGYKRETSNFKYVHTTDSATYVGDEPLLHKQRHPNIIVSVAKNRNKGVSKILRDFPEVDVIVMDDGLQHRWINPGLKILTTPYDKPYFNDWIFPLGNLREKRSAAKRSDIIIISKSPEEIDTNKKKRIISKSKISKSQDVFFSKINYSRFKELGSNTILEDYNDYNITLVTGIANSSLILEYVKKIDKNTNHICFNDHHKYKLLDIQKILRQYNKVKSIKKLILTTEKDAVKLIDFIDYLEDVKIYTLAINITFEKQEPFKEKILDYVEHSKRNN